MVSDPVRTASAIAIFLTICSCYSWQCLFAATVDDSTPMTRTRLYGIQAAAVCLLVAATVMITLGSRAEGRRNVAAAAAVPITVAVVLYTVAIVQNFRHGKIAMRTWGYYASQILAAAFTVDGTVLFTLGAAERNAYLIVASFAPALVALVCWWQSVRKKRTLYSDEGTFDEETATTLRLAEQKAEALRVANPLSFAGTALINGLGGAGLLSGTSVGDVSDVYPTEITPASFGFGIWGVIYTLMAVFCVYTVLQPVRFVRSASADRIAHVTNANGTEEDSQNSSEEFSESKRKQLAQPEPETLSGNPVDLAGISPSPLLCEQIGWLFVVSNLLNQAWISVFVWNSVETLWVSTVIIIGLEASLIAIYISAQSWRSNRETVLEFFAIDIAFSVYLSWVTVATILNISLALKASEWTGAPWTETGWGCVTLSAAAFLSLLTLHTRKDFCYPAVFCWAAVAIAANANDSTNAQIVAASLSLVGIVGAAALMVVGEWSIAILREGRAAMPPAWILSTGTLGCFTCCIGDDERARRGSLNSNDRTDFNEGLLS